MSVSRLGQELFDNVSHLVYWLHHPAHPYRPQVGSPGPANVTQFNISHSCQRIKQQGVSQSNEEAHKVGCSPGALPGASKAAVAGSCKQQERVKTHIRDSLAMSSCNRMHVKKRGVPSAWMTLCKKPTRVKSPQLLITPQLHSIQHGRVQQVPEARVLAVHVCRLFQADL